MEIQAFFPVVSFIFVKPSVLGSWDTRKAGTCQTHCTCEQPSSDLSGTGAAPAHTPTLALPAVNSPRGPMCQAERLKAQSASFHLLLDNCCDAVTRGSGPRPLPALSPPPLPSAPHGLLIYFY